MSYANQLEQTISAGITGTVVSAVGLTASAAGLPVPTGAVVSIRRRGGMPVLAEVVGFKNDCAILYPYSNFEGVRRGDKVELLYSSRWIRAGEALLGRVVNALGDFVDGGPQPFLPHRVPVDASPPQPCQRPRIDTPLGTGIRAIDALLTCGKGQRVGIFAGSGVGKSVLLGMMARHTQADVIVMALIGERGRELNDFIERDLGPNGLRKSVLVVATSNEPALLRVRAAFTATAIAEYFRDRGLDVLLLMDSITRLAMAQREIGLAAGEPPTTRGYPPSVFAMLPRLVERAGRSPRGTITAFYSVLVEADDPNEPIADAVRGLLDGHVWLSRKLASRSHYPAIDVLESISRLMPDVTTAEHQEAATIVRRLLAAYRDHEDLISIGAYRKGANPWVDTAIELREKLEQFLCQKTDERSDFESAKQALVELANKAKEKLPNALTG